MNPRKLNVRRLLLGAALIVAAPLAANAQSASIYQGGETAYTEFPVYQSTKSRAEVQAEVLQARRDGSLDAMQRMQSPANRLTGAERKSRADVVNEMRNEPAAQRAARQQLMLGA